MLKGIWPAFPHEPFSALFYIPLAPHLLKMPATSIKFEANYGRLDYIIPKTSVSSVELMFKSMTTRILYNYRISWTHYFPICTVDSTVPVSPPLHKLVVAIASGWWLEILRHSVFKAQLVQGGGGGGDPI